MRRSDAGVSCAFSFAAPPPHRNRSACASCAFCGGAGFARTTSCWHLTPTTRRHSRRRVFLVWPRLPDPWLGERKVGGLVYCVVWCGRPAFLRLELPKNSFRGSDARAHIVWRNTFSIIDPTAKLLPWRHAKGVYHSIHLCCCPIVKSAGLPCAPLGLSRRLFLEPSRQSLAGRTTTGTAAVPMQASTQELLGRDKKDRLRSIFLYDAGCGV